MVAWAVAYASDSVVLLQLQTETETEMSDSKPIVPVDIYPRLHSTVPREAPKVKPGLLLNSETKQAIFVRLAFGHQDKSHILETAPPKVLIPHSGLRSTYTGGYLTPLFLAGPKLRTLETHSMKVLWCA